MQTYRVYFMDEGAIIAADMIEAASHGDAAKSAVRGLGAYPWAGKLTPTRLEIWQGATFHQSASIALAAMQVTGPIAIAACQVA